MGRALRDGRWWYYLDDGLYGSYSGQMYDHAVYPVEALVPGGQTFPSVLAGPTCDSIDVIREQLELPKLDVGDLVVGRDDGRLHLGLRLGIQFLPARHGAGARSRAAAAPTDGAPMSWSRRRVLAGARDALAGMSAAGLLTGDGGAAPESRPHGALRSTNLHTDERLDVEYFRDGAYRPASARRHRSAAAGFSQR